MKSASRRKKANKMITCWGLLLLLMTQTHTPSFFGKSIHKLISADIILAVDAFKNLHMPTYLKASSSSSAHTFYHGMHHQHQHRHQRQRNEWLPFTSLQSTQSSLPSSSSEVSECPFVKYFPRYRINLTSRSPRSKDKKSSWFSFPSIDVVSRTFSKRAMEAKLLSSSNNQQKKESLIWAPGLDGVSALNKLWTEADRFLQQEDNQNNVSIVVALPDASPSLIKNWMEIMDWMVSNYPFGTTHSILDVSMVDTSSGADTDALAIRIRKHGETKLKPRISEDTNLEEKFINKRTQSWVQRILVEQGICPFTKSVKMSGQGLTDVGISSGSIAYHSSNAVHPVSLFADTYAAIEKMLAAGPSGKSGVSSILLAAPAFDDDFDLWSGPIFAMLESSVVAALAEDQIGVVCFHPEYACPDGSSWPGFGHMHSVTRLEKWYSESALSGSVADCRKLSTEEIAAGGAWQRRTPHATINVLRADQLAAAEGKRSSGDLYPANIDKLVGINGIGSEKLALDLEAERQISL